MPSKQAAADDWELSDSDGPDLNEAMNIKKELMKIHAQRSQKRKEIEVEFNKKLNDLRKRVKKRVADHTEKIAEVSQGQIDRLLDAIEARDALLAVIDGKLAGIQEEGTHLLMHLDEAYGYRQRKAESSGIAHAQREMATESALS